eukprot:8685211-Pyramimonas_sp.AAC.1
MADRLGGGNILLHAVTAIGTLAPTYTRNRGRSSKYNWNTTAENQGTDTTLLGTTTGQHAQEGK